MGPMDAFIAAIASQRGFAVVTRNVVDFADIAVEVVNPWSTT
jgi:predicted nucleic acid-binding protein